jgi:hypothetical protein
LPVENCLEISLARADSPRSSRDVTSIVLIDQVANSSR